MENLLPCPFCGGKAKLKDWIHIWEYGTIIKCVVCGACVSEDAEDGNGWHKRAVKKWNRRAQQEQLNEPLTLEELRDLVGGMAWCDDTDGIAPGLVCLREGWDDYKKELHIWLLDNEGNIGVYDMHTMMECGAKFYRRKPE